MNKEGENERLLTPGRERETLISCLCAACLLAHVGETGQLHLLAGSDVADGQMAGEEENV